MSKTLVNEIENLIKNDLGGWSVLGETKDQFYLGHNVNYDTEITFTFSKSNIGEVIVDNGSTGNSPVVVIDKDLASNFLKEMEKLADLW